jgi:single-strand selective monofunctional uracil DNA glycosylase
VTGLVPIVRRLAGELDGLAFGSPAVAVYNPLVYAREPLERYLERWGTGRREIVLVGMNPGPFGMMQTGVPFGEVALVRDWLGIEEAVGKPPREHPKRPVEGFACRRSEVSGARLWGWARDRFGTPERFFARFFVWNWCPLGFLAASGANLTPDKLRRDERRALASICDRALGEALAELAPRIVFGVGQVALDAVRRASDGRAGAPSTALLPHPSPASPAANRGWTALAERAFADAGVELPPRRSG